MKKLSVVSAVIAALFIAGCSSKEPAVERPVTPPRSSDTGSMDIGTLTTQIQNQVQNIYFDFDKFAIRDDMQEAISTNAALFNTRGAESLKVIIEGNCDEWGSDEYNYALGLKRAKAAKDALVSQGVSESRLEVVSNGESKPVCSEKSKDCDAQNRRDEFKIIR